MFVQVSCWLVTPRSPRPRKGFRLTHATSDTRDLQPGWAAKSLNSYQRQHGHCLTPSSPPGPGCRPHQLQLTPPQRGDCG